MIELYLHPLLAELDDMGTRLPSATRASPILAHPKSHLLQQIHSPDSRTSFSTVTAEETYNVFMFTLQV